MRHGIGWKKILGTIHIYPTLGRSEQVRRGAGARRGAPEACCVK